MPLPTFVIVGAQKSGTTTLHDWLAQVPGVWMSDPKELHYFDRQWRRRGLRWYAKQFEPASDDRAWGESTPSYLYRYSARERIAEALPEARFVAILREPVSRAYSQYWFARAKGSEPLDTFEEAIAAEPARLDAHPERQPSLGSYLDRGRYHGQLVDLARLVGRDRMLVLLLEDLEQQPHETLARVCRFVGIEDAALDGVRMSRSNYAGAYTRNSERRHVPHDGSPAGADVPRDPYPPIDADLERELRAAFADDNAKLAEWLQRDLSAWG